jgi:anhydro-N-acetylmuramic acid kinase
MANVTIIPPAARPEDVIAFDTGPGNMVINAFVREFTQGRQNYDRDGLITAPASCWSQRRTPGTQPSARPGL